MQKEPSTPNKRPTLEKTQEESNAPNKRPALEEMQEESRRPALEGVRVLDFSQNLPGPYATMMLASLGAEVIKIEPPQGDAARGIGQLFSLVNRGKKSVVIDLKHDDGREQIQQILPSIDILVEGFRPGVMAQFGLDAMTLHAMYPRLIYCSISGFGQEGPYTARPGHDLNFQALCGACYMDRDAEGKPHGYALPIADLSGAMTAVSSILAALYQRERLGHGASLDVTLSDALFSWVIVWSQGLSPKGLQLRPLLKQARRFFARPSPSSLLGPILESLRHLVDSPRADDLADDLSAWLSKRGLIEEIERLRLYLLPHYDLYRTQDGRYLSFGIVNEERFWRDFCRQIGLDILGQIPLWGRFFAATPLRSLLMQVFRRRTLAQWLATIDLEKIPITPVLTVEEALKDPQLRRRMEHAGELQLSPLPQRIGMSARAPRLGEHTDEILHPNA